MTSHKKQAVTPLPQLMRAIDIVDGRLQLCQRPVPRPQRGEVLIRVMAAGVNRPDLLQRRGLYPPPPGASDIPGLEVAGVVVDSAGKAGKSVVALASGGGYAEYIAVPAGHCLPLPQGFSFIEGAALPETFFTVWRNVFVLGQLTPGETLLLHGGNSGIGTAAIQMARAQGTTVIATVRNAALVKKCRALGADHVIDISRQPLVKTVQRLTDGRGCNLVLDMLGGDYVAQNLDCLAPQGRHVSIAMLQGVQAHFDIRKVMHKQLSLTGSTLRAQPVEVKAALARGLRKNIWPALDRGQIGPVIAAVYPLAEAQTAHDHLEAGGVFGKIILTMT